VTFTGHTMVTITAKATADGTPALRYQGQIIDGACQ